LQQNIFVSAPRHRRPALDLSRFPGRHENNIDINGAERYHDRNNADAG